MARSKSRRRHSSVVAADAADLSKGGNDMGHDMKTDQRRFDQRQDPKPEPRQDAKPEPKPEPPIAAATVDVEGEKFFALSRCRYSSNGKVVTAEAGDEIVSPDPRDLQDMVEHGCVETFDPGQVKAILSLKSKAPEAKRRLAALLGF